MAQLFSGHPARFYFNKIKLEAWLNFLGLRGNFYFNKIKLEPTSNKYFMVYIDDLTGYDVH